MTVVAAIVASVAILGMLGISIALLFGDRIIILWGIREIRKQAEMMPEDRRESFLREQLAHVDQALAERENSR